MYYTFSCYTALSIELQASETNDVIMAGMQYSLGCVVTLLNSTLSSPNITLYGPDSLPVTNSTDLVITYASADSGDVTVTLDIVTHTSHAGRYRCEAVLSNGEQADVTEHLIVRSKYHTVHMLYIQLTILTEE